MAVPPALIVSMTFNPPDVSIVGPIAESTILKLNELLPQLSSLSPLGRKVTPLFEFHEKPLPHWTLYMKHLVFDEKCQMAAMLTILDCIEHEGCWSMRNSHANAFSDMDTYKFFFTKKSR